MDVTSSPLHDRMIFVVGAQRSGTNWLERIIGAHPTVFVVPAETNLFALGIRPFLERFQHGIATSPVPGKVYVARDRLHGALRAFCDTIFEDLRSMLAPDAQRVLERTPDHARTIDIIGDVYPDARFIHIIRDGRDVARSLLAQPWGPTTLEDAMETWTTVVSAARGAGPKVPHYMEIRYEALLASPEQHIREIYARLDLPASEDDIARALQASGIRFNVDPTAPAVKSEKWRDHFSADDLATVERVGGELLDELGYERASSGPPSRAPAKTPRPKRSIAGIVRQKLRRTPALVDTQWEVNVGATFVEAVFDKIHTGRASELKDVISTGAFVRVVTPTEDWSGRRPADHDRFIDALERDEVLRRPQRRGDFHPSLRLYTVVTSYDGGDRVFVLWVQDDKIQRIVYYQLPLGR